MRALVSASLLLVLASARPAQASEDEELTWTWRQVGPLDYAAALAFGAGVLADRLAPPPTTTRWGYAWDVDRDARDALVLGSSSARTVAARASDVTVGLLNTQPYVDSIVAWTVHDSFDVAWQISVVSATAMLFNMATTGLVKRLSGRDRPITIACDADDSYDETCSGRPPRAFYSGHASSAFTAASLTCLHHSHLALYGEGWDQLACAAAVSAAAMVAHERVTSDRHHLTDVVTGAAMGAVSGGVLPFLLYERLGTPSTDWLVWPRFGENDTGVSAMTRW
jgi:membrane-associated phospholipid phosphatase